MLRRRVEGGLARRHARLEEALRRAGPPRRRARRRESLRSLNLSPSSRSSALRSGFVLGAREPGDLDASDPRLLAGVDDHRDRPAVGRGILADVERARSPPDSLRDAGGRGLRFARASRRAGSAGPPSASAAVAARSAASRPRSPVQLQALEERTPRHAKAKPDAAGLLDRLDLDAVEDAERPEAVEALTHARARERLAGEVGEELIDRRPGELMARDHLDRRHHGSRRSRTRPGDRGRERGEDRRERHQRGGGSSKSEAQDHVAPDAPAEHLLARDEHGPEQLILDA